MQGRVDFHQILYTFLGQEKAKAFPMRVIWNSMVTIKVIFFLLFFSFFFLHRKLLEEHVITYIVFGPNI